MASPFLSVTHAATAAASGDTLSLAAGTYVETTGITLSKALTIVGAGMGTTTVSRGDALVVGSLGVFNLTSAASGSVFRSLTVAVPDDVPGNSAIAIKGPESVVGLTLDRFEALGSGLAVNTVVGLYVYSGGSLSNLAVTGSRFKQLFHGWSFVRSGGTPPAGCGLPAAGTGGLVSGVNVTDTEFLYNREKGIYVEMLSDAHFLRVTVTGNGSPNPGLGSSVVSSTNGAGFDINLKAGSYSNITIDRSTFSMNGLQTSNGAAIMIKARDDRSYACSPASLDNVVITNNSIINNERGIRFGEPMNINVLPSVLAYDLTPTNVIVRFNQINQNVPQFDGPGADQFGGVIDQTLSASIHVNRNSLVGNGRGPDSLNGIINAQVTNAPGPNNIVDGVCNWWGTPTGPSNSLSIYTTPAGATGTGDMVSSDVDFRLFLLSANLYGPCASFPLDIGPTAAAVPALSGGGLAALFALFAVLGGWLLRRDSLGMKS